MACAALEVEVAMESSDEQGAKKKRAKRKPVPLSQLPADLWEVAECSAYLGMSPDWVYKRSADATLPHRKHGSRLRYIPSEIVRWALESDVRGAD